MQDGMPADHSMASSFEHLYLGMTSSSGMNTHACPWPPGPTCSDEALTCVLHGHETMQEEALACVLHCHETMQEEDVHIPLGPAHHTLVLPGWLRERAGTLTDADWAMLCEVGVAAAMQGEGESVSFDECEMPVLDLSAQDEGFVW